MKEERIWLKKLNSEEFYEQNGSYERVLKDITMRVREREVWAVTGVRAYELKLLLDIISNTKTYDSGTCVLNQRGMMRKKRVILPHLFHIGSTNMMFSNMNVLEYMMFLTSGSKEHPAVRQKNHLDLLIKLGLSHLTLMPVSMLSPAEKSVVILASSLFLKDCPIIVWNLPRIVYDKRSINGAVNICGELKKRGAAIVFSSMDNQLIEAVATHFCYIKNGRTAFQGRKEWLLNRYDKEEWEKVQIGPTVERAIVNLEAKLKKEVEQKVDL